MICLKYNIMMSRIFLLFIFISFFIPSYSILSTSKSLGDFGHWKVFQDKKNKVNYMATFPVKKEGNYNRRGEVYIYIAHHLQGNKKEYNVFCHVAGYPLNRTTPILLKIKIKNNFYIFPLVTDPHDKKSEFAQVPFTMRKEVIKAILRGEKMEVIATSQKGTLTKDYYSLKGSLLAYKRLCATCGYPFKNIQGTPYF